MFDFVSFNNKTQFSLLNSLLSPEELIKRAKELGQTAIGICDIGTLSGVWSAFKAAKEANIKLIVGQELAFLNDVNDKTQRVRSVNLFAINEIGYKNLLLLTRQGFEHFENFGGKVIPIIDWELLKTFNEGLICLTSDGNGIIGQLLNQKLFTEAKDTAKKLQSIFGERLAIEIQTNNISRPNTAYHIKYNQQFTNKHAITIANELGIKLIPTVNSRYQLPDENKTLDVLLAIGARQPIYSNSRVRFDEDNFHLKSGEEVFNFFSRGDKSEFAKSLLENSVWFANLCEFPTWVHPSHSNPSGRELPTFPIEQEPQYSEFLEWKTNTNQPSIEDDKLYLRFLCDKSIQSLKSKPNFQEYQARLKEEIEVLEYQGFSSYMLIVADFLNWARANGVETGPGRGSVSGSLVAYLLNIHKADPLQYDLIFARFQNKERKQAPDIDVDISKKNRHKLVEYVINKYGKENFAHITNLNTITPKVYVKDVSRALELGGSRQDAVKLGITLSDLISKEAITIDDALGNALFSEYANRYKQLIDFKNIDGKLRSFGTHAAGVIINGRPLVGLVPLRKDKEGNIVLEYDKDQAEENNLIKIDLLGLSTLDIISSTIELIKKSGKAFNNECFNYDDYDQKTYDLISSGDTFGVFQFGTSTGTINLCKKIKPKSIEDLAIITTLARPAARDIRDAFIKARDSGIQYTPMHPSLNNAFSKTLGFGLYDESILQVAQDVAGWTLHEADSIRKMIKNKGKDPEKDKKIKEKFIEGTIKQGISAKMANKIWDEIMEKFQGYTFNKSHAITYSFITYTTAYLKAHFPIEFLIANLMNELESNTQDRDSNVDKIKRELKANGCKILPPDLNKSEYSYKLDENNYLLSGFSGVKYVGNNAIDDIIAKRPFNNFFDFVSKIDSSFVRANTVQALTSVGALDMFDLSRRNIFTCYSDYRKKMQIWLKKHNPLNEEFNYKWPVEKDWTLSEQYALEKEYIGESFICSTSHAYGGFFKNPGLLPIKIARGFEDKQRIGQMAGIIVDIFETKIKKEGSKYFGQSMFKLTIEDPSGDRCPLTIFPSGAEQIKDKLKTLKIKGDLSLGMALHFGGAVNIYNGEFGIILNDIYNILPEPKKPDDIKKQKKIIKDTKVEIIQESSIEDIQESIEDKLFDAGIMDIEDDI